MRSDPRFSLFSWRQLVYAAVVSALLPVASIFFGVTDQGPDSVAPWYGFLLIGVVGSVAGVLCYVSVAGIILSMHRAIGKKDNTLVGLILFAAALAGIYYWIFHLPTYKWATVVFTVVGFILALSAPLFAGRGYSEVEARPRVVDE